MYTAIILACNIAVADKCFEIIDTRGPYDTYAQCMERIDVMWQDSKQLIKQNNVPLKLEDSYCEFNHETKET